MAITMVAARPMVLVVEDEPLVASLLHQVLKDAGFSVQSCNGAVEARAIVREFDPDGALIDVNLPDGRGTDLLRDKAFVNMTKEEYDAVNAVKEKAMTTFKVNATPTFFINGQKYQGEMTIEGMEKVIKPIVGA